MSDSGGIFNYLTAEELSRLGRLSIGSRFTVEGSVAGGHRSRLKGVSVEFADYRQYVPGDDPKHLDWRVFGRNERLYLRQYEEETSLRVHLLVDASSSMGCCGSEGGCSKYNFAAKLATALAYITIHHQDGAGLGLFDSRCRLVMPPRGGAEHLRAMAEALHSNTPGGETDLAATLHRLAEQTRRRGLVVILSDLFDDVDKIRAALAHFRRRRHDVIVYQILDRSEVNFPFREAGAFEDPETGRKLVTNPKDVRDAYQSALEAFLLHCRQVCAGLGVDHQLVLTDESAVDFLMRHLRRRALAGR